MWRTALNSSTMRALRLRSVLFSSSSSSASSPSSCSLINICRSSSSSSFTTLTTIITHSHSHAFLPIPQTTLVSLTDSRRFGSPIRRCVSSLPTLDWNDAVSCSEVEVEVDADAAEGGVDGTVEQDTKPSIPVRAFFFSTSVDLKSLVEQNKPNFVPPSSRMTNYIVLKFGDICVSKGPGTFLSGRNGCFVVVFQYGSIVLFNVPEHEVDAYLKIVKKHASGLLPEMRKDGNDSAKISQLKQHLFSHFQTKDLGCLKYFFGIEVTQSKEGVVISQRKYALDILEEIGLTNCRPIDNPMDPNQKLMLDQGEPFPDPERYRRLVGKLIYLTITRPDLPFVVGVASLFMQDPHIDH